MNLCFIDTETTSLRPDRRAWEVAIIHRTKVGSDWEGVWHIAEQDLDLAQADLFSLKIGGFYERHYEAWNRTLLFPGEPVVEPKFKPLPEYSALLNIEAITRGAHLVGNVPGFDAEVLANRMRAHGILPSWHYHLIDIESMIVGYLWGDADTISPDSGVMDLPWNSEDLSRAIGVNPEDFERHTALGDAKWVRAQWDAITT